MRKQYQIANPDALYRRRKFCCIAGIAVLVLMVVLVVVLTLVFRPGILYTGCLGTNFYRRERSLDGSKNYHITHHQQKEENSIEELISVSNTEVIGEESSEVEQLSGDEEWFIKHHGPRKLYKWGQSKQMYGRYSKAYYYEAGERPDARNISLTVLSKPVEWEWKDRTNHKGVSNWLWVWGQFLEHTLTLPYPMTEDPEYLFQNLSGDPFFDPDEEPGYNITLIRDRFVNDVDGVRQQINYVSSFIDASVVYGSTLRRNLILRKGVRGLLQTEEVTIKPGPKKRDWYIEELLPSNYWNARNYPSSDTKHFFLAGDPRVNENLGLMTLQTIFAREHNYWARYYSSKYPLLDDDNIFLLARSKVISEVQVITYKEFFPALMGEKILSTEQDLCYNEKLDPRVYNEFAVGAIRTLHTLISQYIWAKDEQTGKTLHRFMFNETIYRPGWLKKGSFTVGQIALGLGYHPAQEFDPFIVDAIQNTFIPNGQGDGILQPFDLGTIDILRGRDHGIPPFSILKWKMTGKLVQQWEDITNNTAYIERLQQAYGPTGWDNVDAIVGMLCEDKVKHSMLGETSFAIVKDQLIRAMKGDYFFYLWNMGIPKVSIVHKTTLKDILLRNTFINPELLQDNLFYLPDKQPHENDDDDDHHHFHH